MRVLHLHSGNLFGGVETLLLTLARHDGAADLHGEFGVCFDARLAGSLRGLGARVHLLGAVRFSRPLTVWKARKQLRSVLRGERYAAVVCHSPWALALFGATVRAAGVPLVLWQHDAVRGRHWVDRWARRASPDLVICNSHYTRQTLPALFPEVSSVVLYCPVDPVAPVEPADRELLRAELATPEGAAVVLQVGRMEPFKGHAHHLAALARIGAARPWVLWVVGGAQRPQEQIYLEELRALADRLGIADRVRFVGHRGDVNRLLHAADVYSQPNELPEPFGIAIVEALYAGLPVVSTRFGGAEEIVTPDCGVLVAPHDVGALAEALHSLVDRPELRRALGVHGPERARAVSDPQRVLPKLERVIAGLRANGTVGVQTGTAG
jgi:glycosyltransferase involved in cell wall biosynthesis